MDDQDNFQTSDNSTSVDDTAGQQPLPEDNATPFSPPADLPIAEQPATDPPQADTAVAAHEEYDAVYRLQQKLTPLLTQTKHSPKTKTFYKKSATLDSKF